MAIIDNIRTYTRQLVRAPQPAQLANDALDFAINTVYRYDFPNDLKLINLERNITWYCAPSIDRYELSALPLAGSAVDYKNYVVMLSNPIYIAGVPTYLSQNQQEFYNVFPKVNNIIQVGAGNGTNGAFTGNLGYSVLRNNLIFTSISASGASLVLADDGLGALSGAGTGTIDYVTGAFSITFAPTVPAAGVTVYAQWVPVPLTKPFAVLYFNNGFNLRPVPDKSYAITMQIYAQPTALSDTEQEPVLGQWWQFISLMAARYILQTRNDMDTIAQITPELDRQRSLALSNTVNNLTKQRAPSIYMDTGVTPYMGNSWNNYY